MKVPKVTGIDLTPTQEAMVDAVSALCADFPEAYWQENDVTRSYPSEFIDALTRAGWLAMLIPEEYGGGNATVLDAALVLETINRSGGSAYAAHAQMYTMGTILRHGSEDQKRWLLPQLASGAARLQAFAVTEADAGSDTSAITTTAVRDGDEYVVTGSKMWTSRVRQSDWLLLLVRTTPRSEAARPTDGMSLLLVDLKAAGDAVQVTPIRTMVNHETNAVFFDGLRVPVANRVGVEGEGFRHLLSGLNVERVLVASEALGDGYWFIDKATKYASTRVVFGRPIGQNQGVQFPIARAYVNLAAASLMRNRAAQMFDGGGQPGFEANSAKLLASHAAWEAASVAMDTFGGYGLATEYGVERKFREARLYLTAPVTTNMVLSFIGHHILGMPRSY